MLDYIDILNWVLNEESMLENIMKDYKNEKL